MKRISPTLHGFARGFLLAGLSGSALLACSSDPTPENGGGAGAASGGSSSAGTGTTGGSAPQAGTATSAGTASGGSSAGTSSSAGSGGSGGAAAGTSSGGASGSGGAAGGSGGKASGGGGAGGGGGAASGTAVANITGLNGQTVTGTATFTQGATMTKLVLNLTACPNGTHSSHLHLMKDCGDNGNAAGGHWVPNGEMLGNYTCASTMVTHEVSKPIATWTVGDGSATDVTKYAFMVHEMGDTDSGARIGCGVINKQ